MNKNQIAAGIVMATLLLTCRSATSDSPRAEVVKKLLLDLKSADAGNRLKAAELLSKHKSHADEIIPELKKSLLSEKDEGVAYRAAVSIAAFERRGEDELVELAGHTDPRVRRYAISALKYSETSNATTVKQIIHRLSDADPDVRMAIPVLISSVKYRDAIVDVIKLVKNDRDERVRISAINAVADIGTDAAVCAPVLIEILGEGEGKWTGLHRAGFRGAATNALGAIGRGAMPLVMNALRDSKINNQLKIDLMSAIARNTSNREFPAAVPIVGAFLEDADAEVRTRALLALSFYESKLVKPFQPTIAKLIRRPGSKDEQERALQSMIEIDHSDRALHEALKGLLNSRIADDRETATRLLGLAPHSVIRDYVGVLQKLLDDMDETIRYGVIETLSNHVSTSDKEILDKLKKMADHDPGPTH